VRFYFFQADIAMAFGKSLNNDKLDNIVAQAHQNSAERDKGYRERSLKMYPWVCGRCARNFTRENLRELTVHHRDHDHDNNPNDGSNWELLCVYCHDNEHQKQEEFIAAAGKGSTSETDSVSTKHNPFAGLKNMMKNR
jgi:hypothetical protein